ncbi:MAG: MoxR family ATPase [Bacteroidota bacterium]
MSESATQTDIQLRLQALREGINRYLIGQDQMVHQLLIGLLAGGHVLVEGVPGLAKTLATKLLARSIDAHFTRLQFTPDLMPSDVLGTSVFHTGKGEFEFRPGPIFGQMVLIDEVNRAPAKTQAALFEVMEERQVTMDGQTYRMAQPFMVLATQNPVEHEGTYRLPEGQIDRFLLKIVVDYPEADAEVDMLGRLLQQGGRLDEASLEATLTAEELLHMQLAVRQVQVHKPVLQYIVNLIQTTRSRKEIELGASPRASLALMQAAQAEAVMQGRDFVIPEDIQALWLPVLRHRILLTPEQEMEEVKPEEVLERLLKQVDVPR